MPTWQKGGSIRGPTGPAGPAGPAAGRFVVRGTNQVISVTSNTEVTNLGFSLGGGIDYQFLFNVAFLTNATTTGLGLAMTGPASGVAYGLMTIKIQNAAATFALGSFSGVGSWSTGLVAATGPGPATVWMAEVWGSIRLDPSAVGTIQLVAKSEIAVASGVTILAPSHGRCHP